MIKRSPTKPVRVVPPMMEEQEVSTITLQKWLDREETVSHLLFCKGKEEGIDKSYKSFKNCTFQHQTFSECKFRSSQLTDVRFENCEGAEMRPQSMSSTAASAAAVTVTGRLSARAQAKDSAKRPPGRISPMTTRWPSALVRLTCTWPVSTALLSGWLNLG